MHSRRAQRRRPAKCRSVRFPQGGGSAAQSGQVPAGGRRRPPGKASSRNGRPDRSPGRTPRRMRLSAPRRHVQGVFASGAFHTSSARKYTNVPRPESTGKGLTRSEPHFHRDCGGRNDLVVFPPPFGDGCRSGAIPAESTAERCRNGSQRAATSYRSSGTIRRQANAAEPPPRNRGAPRGGAGPPSKPYRLFRTAARSATEGPRPPSSRFSRIRAIR